MIEEPGYNRKKRRKKGKTKKEWEKLREAPIAGISTMADGSLVSAPISGKALPRLGRAIRSSMTPGVITGDQNPLTRVDGNENGLIFDGTWREMPDPTPGNRGGVSGMMGRRDNPTQFVGLDVLLDKHFAQSGQFDEWEKNNDWNAFHRNHFDWWMFPIPRGSNSYGDGYNITGEPLETLKTNENYMQSLAKSVRQYFRAMAWDIDKNDWVKDADVNNGQNPIRNINSARLYKIAQSTYAHGMMKEHRSIRNMANSLISSGVRVGNEDYWTSPIGVSGRMSFGNNINPTKFEPEGEIIDPFSKEWKDLWDSRDDMSPNYTKKLWDWTDEEARRRYATRLTRQKFDKGYLGWGDGGAPGKTLTGTALELMPILERELGVIHQKKGPYPGLHEPYGGIVTHSASPKGVKSDANIVKDFLGKYSEDINPFEFYTRFENWIRNPFVTMRDPKTGSTIGVRKYFNNDRQLMLAEFRSRVKKLFDTAYMKEHGKTYNEWRGSDQDAIELSPKEILSALKTTHPDVIDKSKALIPRIMNSNPRSMHRFHSIFSDELSLRASQEDIRLITPGVLREIIKENIPSFDEDMNNKFPDFFEPDDLADLNDSQIELARMISDSVIDELIEFDKEGIKIPQASVVAFAETMRGEFDNFTDTHARSILTDSVLKLDPKKTSRGMDGVSGKMSTPDSIEAEYIGYNPDNPESIANHMLSPESSYDVRPKPVKSIQEARDTGAPLEWLMPGNYPPEIEEILNDLTDYVISNRYTSIEDVREMGTGKPENVSSFKALIGEKAGELQSTLSRLGFGVGSDRELSVEEQSIVEALAGVKVKLFSEVPMDSEDPRAAMLKNLIQLNPYANEINQVALGLIQRATTAGFKTNFLSAKYGQGNTVTEETLEQWKRTIQSAISVNAPELNDVEPHELPIELSVAMPIQATLDMLQSGKFKTLFESGTSRGNSMDSIRRVQEFTLFGYLPSFSGQRPIYGVTAPDGLTEGNLDATHHYGPIKLVMKPDVNSRSTWTESDSLSLASTASSFSNPTKHALFSQELKGDLLSFAKSDSGYERFDYTEAQIHGGVALSDVAYIVIDDRFYDDPWRGASEWPAVDEAGQPIDNPNWAKPDNLDDYGPYIQISRIAQSLNIPIVRASEVIDAGEDEVFKP
jgi:hypothetical protein